MRRSPFGPGAVVPGGRYLGAWLEAPAWGQVRAGLGWGRAAFWRVADGTWNKAMHTMTERSRALTAQPASPLIRAGQWNTYCASTVPYPAQLALPTCTAIRHMASCARDVFRTSGWSPWWVVTAIPVHWGIRGGPRCPAAVADAAGVVTALKGRTWGPPDAGRRQQADLDKLAGVAAGAAAGDRRDQATRDARLMMDLVHARAATGSADTSGAGAAIYRLAWRARHEQALHRWLVHTAARRRWLRDDGQAWRLIGRARYFNAAYHTLKLLAGGVRGRAQRRPAAARPRPHRCFACGAAEVGVVWRSPTEDEEGVAWCIGCRPTDARGLLAAARAHGHDDVAVCARVAGLVPPASAAPAASPAGHPPAGATPLTSVVPAASPEAQPLHAAQTRPSQDAHAGFPAGTTVSAPAAPAAQTAPSQAASTGGPTGASAAATDPAGATAATSEASAALPAAQPLAAQADAAGVPTGARATAADPAGTAGGDGPAEEPWRCSRHGACALCGGGEAGGEHLIQWCPAVQAALEELMPGSASLADACHEDTGRDQLLSDLIHQTAYLHGTMQERHCMTWRRAARVLVASTRRAMRGEHEHDEAAADERPPDGGCSEAQDICPTWEELCDSGCAECGALAVNAVRRGPANAGADQAAQHGLWRPHAARAFGAGDAAMAQVADAAAAAWPAEGRNWCPPPPRMVRGEDAACDWHPQHCAVCGRHRRMLRARAPLPEGAELTVPHGRGGNLGWSGEVDIPLVTFDGGAHAVRGRWVAGGAAVLWATVDDERRPSVTRMWAIPRGTDSQVAEAWGAEWPLSSWTRKVADLSRP